jgi:hypothetical protein
MDDDVYRLLRARQRTSESADEVERHWSQILSALTYPIEQALPKETNLYLITIATRILSGINDPHIPPKQAATEIAKMIELDAHAIKTLRERKRNERTYLVLDLPGKTEAQAQALAAHLGVGVSTVYRRAAAGFTSVARRLNARYGENVVDLEAKTRRNKRK